MKKLLFTLILALVAGTAFAGEPVLWKAEDGGNDHYYQVVEKMVTFEEAMEGAKYNAVICPETSHLVTISSEDENFFVSKLLNQTVNHWIGLTRDKNKWEWVTGERFTYENFCKEGDENFVVFSDAYDCDGGWQTVSSKITAYYIIEWDDAAALPNLDKSFGDVKSLYK